MTTFAAIAACVVLTALATFQVMLAAGAPLGRFAWGGQHPGALPTGLRVGSAISVLVYALIALLLLDRADILSTGLVDAVIRIGAWVVTGYFVLGTGMNLASRSRDERRVMVPVAAALGLLALTVALG